MDGTERRKIERCVEGDRDRLMREIERIRVGERAREREG